MNKSYKTLLIGLMGYAFLWGLINSYAKFNVPRIELGPPSVEAAGGVTVCRPGAFGSDTLKCADVTNGDLHTTASLSGGTSGTPFYVIIQGTPTYTIVDTQGHDAGVDANHALLVDLAIKLDNINDSISTYAASGSTKTYNNALFTNTSSAAWTVPANAVVTYAQNWASSSTASLLLCFTSTCDSTHNFASLTQFQTKNLSFLGPGNTVWAATNGPSGSGLFFSVAKP